MTKNLKIMYQNQPFDKNTPSGRLLQLYGWWHGLDQILRLDTIPYQVALRKEIIRRMEKPDEA